MQQQIHARGHENVSADHTSTFEVTSDDYLTPAGDCIVGIEADRTPAAFDDSFVEACKDHEATISITLEADGHVERVTASGHPDLTFESDRSLVVRTSDYIDGRTVAVDASCPAAFLDTDLVAALSDGSDLVVTLAVE